MALAPRLGQEGAHDLLQEFASEARENGTSLQDFLAERPEVAEKIKGIDISELTQPENYTGLSRELSMEAAQPNK